MGRPEFARSMTQYSPAGIPVTLTVAIRRRSRDHGILALTSAFPHRGHPDITAYLNRDAVYVAATVAADALDIAMRRAPQPERLFSAQYESPAGTRETIAALVPEGTQGVAELSLSYRQGRARLELGVAGWRWLLDSLMELRKELDRRAKGQR